MSQHDYDISNADGSTFRSDVNSALLAAVSLNGGASAPSTTFAYMLWADTTNGLLKQRDAANSAWIIRGTLAETRAVSKTGAYTVVDDDFGKLFKCTNTFSLALTAAATLGDGFMFSVRNTGSGTITIDPNGSEQIDGATTIALAAGESCSVWCDGSAFYSVGRSASTSAVVYGQCRLTKSGSNLLLMPNNGNLLTVNGTACTVPDAGLTLAPTSLIADTTYYIYALATGGVLSSIEASTTAWQISTTTGNKGTPIKTGDDTRTLVGMARIVTGPAWSDADAARLVLSYWNRRPIAAAGSFTGTVRQTTSSTLTEVDSGVRTKFLTWADCAVDASINTDCGNNSIATPTFTALNLDGSTSYNTVRSDCSSGGAYNAVSCGVSEALSEGYHYFTMFGATNGSGSAQWCASTASKVLRVVVAG